MILDWMARKCSPANSISKWRKLKCFQSLSKSILISHRTPLRFVSPILAASSSTLPWNVNHASLPVRLIFERKEWTRSPTMTRNRNCRIRVSGIILISFINSQTSWLHPWYNHSKAHNRSYASSEFWESIVNLSLQEFDFILNSISRQK
jgi:hypothetical protein